MKIVSDTQLSAGQGQAIAQRIQDARAYDMVQQQWRDTSPQRQQITVQVLSKSNFTNLVGNNTAAGVTLGPNLMAVPEDVLNRQNPDDDNTLAHELVHVQDFAASGEGVQKIPVYVQEGKAIDVGSNFPIALQEGNQDPELGYTALALGSITGAQAQDTMNHFRTPSDEYAPQRNVALDEAIGGLYVEFLKTRLNDTGYGDAVPKLAQVFADVGKGSSYDDAFAQQFGVSSQQSEQDFVQYITDTEGSPADRLQGTLWEPYLDTSNDTQDGN